MTLKNFSSCWDLLCDNGWLASCILSKINRKIGRERDQMKEKVEKLRTGYP